MNNISEEEISDKVAEKQAERHDPSNKTDMMDY